MMNFDMQRIGQTIAKLRKDHNMTQLHLADEMGVSYQAVSNWERGQTMPDIAKLPDLALLFDTTIDELLGKHAPLIAEAAEGNFAQYVADNAVSAEEAVEAAPVLTPTLVETVGDAMMAEATTTMQERFARICGLLPFMRTEKIDEMLVEAAKQGYLATEAAPFASDSALNAAADALVAQGKSIAGFLPFFRTEKVDSFLLSAAEQGIERPDLAPFASNKALIEAMQRLARAGAGYSGLLPFLSAEAIEKMAQREWKA